MNFLHFGTSRNTQKLGFFHPSTLPDDGTVKKYPFFSPQPGNYPKLTFFHPPTHPSETTQNYPKLPKTTPTWPFFTFFARNAKVAEFQHRVSPTWPFFWKKPLLCTSVHFFHGNFRNFIIEMREFATFREKTRNFHPPNSPQLDLFSPPQLTPRKLPKTTPTWPLFKKFQKNSHGWGLPKQVPQLLHHPKHEKNSKFCKSSKTGTLRQSHAEKVQKKTTLELTTISTR